MKRAISLTLLASIIALPVSAKDLATLEAEISDLQHRVTTLEALVQNDADNSEKASSQPSSMLLTALGETGKIKFNTFCTACHKPNFESPMLAPPIAMVKEHYQQIYRDDKDAFVKAVVAWVKAPSPEKTLMPGAIQNFNIMPPFPLPDPDLTAIATYLFEADIPQPTGFEKHLEEERLQLGRGQGNGMGPPKQ